MPSVLMSRSSSSRCLIQPAQCVSRPWLNLDNGPEATESVKAPAQKSAEEAAASQASEEATAESRADEELQARQTEREVRRQAARASEEAAAKQAASGMVDHQPMDFKFLVVQGSSGYGVLRREEFRQKPRQITKTEVRLVERGEEVPQVKNPRGNHRTHCGFASGGQRLGCSRLVPVGPIGARPRLACGKLLRGRWCTGMSLRRSLLLLLSPHRRSSPTVSAWPNGPDPRAYHSAGCCGKHRPYGRCYW